MASSTEMSRNKILSGAGSPRSGSLHHPTSSPARDGVREKSRFGFASLQVRRGLQRFRLDYMIVLFYP